MTTRPDNSVLAWHFSNADCTLGNGDDRKIVAGETLTVDCVPVLCKAGLHGSARLVDALNYAPGPFIWRVRISGDIAHGDDKLCGTSRKSLWGFDATALLREFARKCALNVAHLWDMPAIVRQYLETGDESLRAAAGDAAWVASGDAAGDADAAGAAARAAAWDAAWDAARGASGAAAAGAAAAGVAAAGDAAWGAAWGAAWEAQNKLITQIVMAEYRRLQSCKRA